MESQSVDQVTYHSKVLIDQVTKLTQPDMEIICLPNVGMPQDDEEERKEMLPFDLRIFKSVN